MGGKCAAAGAALLLLLLLLLLLPGLSDFELRCVGSLCSLMQMGPAAALLCSPAEGSDPGTCMACSKGEEWGVCPPAPTTPPAPEPLPLPLLLPPPPSDATGAPCTPISSPPRVASAQDTCSAAKAMEERWGMGACKQVV